MSKRAKSSKQTGVGKQETRHAAGSLPGGALVEPLAAGSAQELPRHRLIYEELLSEIQSGMYQIGERLPSEAMLGQRFQVSRITIARAIQTLQRDNLVSRRAGSGTYIERPRQETALQFGLLIPELGTTEIFEPICQGMMRSPLSKAHSLTWSNSAGSGADTEEAAEELCQRYIAQRVAGVFFAPMDSTPGRDQANRRIASALERARIPVVLLDRCYEKYPDRAPFDRVGIDNHRAGFVLTRHLLQAGARRVVFATCPRPASTVDARIAGFSEALRTIRPGMVPCLWNEDFENLRRVEAALDQLRPDGIVCANDITAARLMHSLVTLGVLIPEQVRIVGIDDVNYARFLPVPLTTLRQDCAEIGSQAMATMLDLLERPNHPRRDILVDFELVVRSSCGSIRTRLETAG